jgi:hypothetical protein
VHVQHCMREQLCMLGLGVSACFLLECCYLIYFMQWMHLGMYCSLGAQSVLCSAFDIFLSCSSSLKDVEAEQRKEMLVTCCTAGGVR